MAIEIVDVPINSMVIFHCFLYVHQRVFYGSKVACHSPAMRTNNSGQVSMRTGALGTVLGAAGAGPQPGDMIFSWEIWIKFKEIYAGNKLT